jgi:hypothetical protein
MALSPEINVVGLTSLQQYRDLERQKLTLQGQIDTLQLRHTKALSDLASFSAVDVINAESPTDLQQKLDALQLLLSGIQSQLDATEIATLQAIADKAVRNKLAAEQNLIVKLNSLGVQYAATY